MSAGGGTGEDLHQDRQPPSALSAPRAVSPALSPSVARIPVYGPRGPQSGNAPLSNLHFAANPILILEMIGSATP